MMMKACVMVMGDAGKLLEHSKQHVKVEMGTSQDKNKRESFAMRAFLASNPHTGFLPFYIPLDASDSILSPDQCVQPQYHGDESTTLAPSTSRASLDHQNKNSRASTSSLPYDVGL
jgi:hypothetical protein